MNHLSSKHPYGTVEVIVKEKQRRRISFNIWSRIQVNSPALNSLAHLGNPSMCKFFHSWHQGKNTKFISKSNHLIYYQTPEFRKMLKDPAFTECIWLDFIKPYL